MGILSLKSKRTSHRYIGASLPLLYHDYISLYTVAKGSTKTDILKTLFDHWMTEQQAKYSERDLVLEIIERIKEQCRVACLVNREFDMKAFKKTIEQELLDKNIPYTTVTKILKNIE